MPKTQIKKVLRKNIDRSGRFKQYFLRGHSSWFSLAFSMINFTLITYNFAFKNLFFVPDFLKHFSIYLILFLITYIPLATLLGYLDYKKGTYKAEQRLTRSMSPVWNELFSDIEILKHQQKTIIDKINSISSSLTLLEEEKNKNKKDK